MIWNHNNLLHPTSKHALLCCSWPWAAWGHPKLAVPRFVLGTCRDKILQGSLPCLCWSWSGACVASFVDPGWIHSLPKHGGAWEHVKKEEEKGFAFCLLLKDWEGKGHREPGGKCILKAGKANDAKWTKASRPRALWISIQPPPVCSQWPPASSKAAIWGLLETVPKCLMDSPRRGGRSSFLLVRSEIKTIFSNMCRDNHLLIKFQQLSFFRKLLKNLWLRSGEVLAHWTKRCAGALRSSKVSYLCHSYTNVLPGTKHLLSEHFASSHFLFAWLEKLFSTCQHLFRK